MACEEARLTFETEDHYGPDLKLVVDTCSIGAVSLTISGHQGSLMELKAEYTLFYDEVEKVAGHLSKWLTRYEERFGKKEGGE